MKASQIIVLHALLDILRKAGNVSDLNVVFSFTLTGGSVADVLALVDAIVLKVIQ